MDLRKNKKWIEEEVFPKILSDPKALLTFLKILQKRGFVISPPIETMSFEECQSVAIRIIAEITARDGKRKLPVDSEWN